MFGSCENRAIRNGCDVRLKYQYQYFYVRSHRGDIRHQSIKYITSQPFSTLSQWRVNQYARTTRSSKWKQESTSLMHWNQARCKFAWKCRDMQVFPFSGFNCIVLSSVFESNTFFLGLRSNFLRVQSCGFTLYQWRAGKRWLSTWCTFAPHMPHICVRNIRHKIARQMAKLTAVFLQFHP